MNNFEITIQHQPRSKDYYPVVVEYTHPDGLLPIRLEGKLEFDEDTQRQLKRLALKPKKYGEMLGDLLFSDRKLYGAFTAAHSDEGLRILLSVEAPELRGLHWERLAAPLDDDRLVVLARSQNHPFSLSLASSRGKRFRPIGQHDLRALVVVANPADIEEHGLAAFDDQAAIKNIQAALGNIPSDVLAATPGAKGLPTVDNLLAALTEQDYPILHLVAHGQYLKSEGETNVYLVNAQNQADPVAASDLIDYLYELKNMPRFAFLVTCESGDPEAEVEGNLGGLGQRLVRELGLHVTVAMTDKVTITTAEALAPIFYERLRQHGQPDMALVEAGASLTQRRDIRDFIVPVLFSRLRGRPLYSDAGERPPTGSEIKAGLIQMEALLEKRAPILLEPFRQQRRQLEQSLEGTTREAEQERGEALRQIDEMCYEILDFSFADLARTKQPPPYEAICPFPGLKAFGLPDDQESGDTRKFFFGREALVTDLEQMIGRHNFLAALGASGSGKSSLVMAGLVPALQAKQPDLRLAYLKPGPIPTRALQTALTPFQDNNSPLIIVIDQFEELFTLAGEQERQAFLSNLLTLIEPEPPDNPKSKIQNPKSKIIITMRADFIGECAPYEELAALIEQHTKLVPPMKPVELREAISKQAEAVSLRFDPDLINTIMEDIVSEPGAMPLLQHALRELWDRRHGRWLRASAYRDLGGIQKAIAQTATELYDSLTLTEQTQARDIFTRLTRVDEEALQGEARRDTRRRVAFDKLVLSGQDESQIEQLVEKLANARLVVTSIDEISGEKEVEVTHEALIRHWPLLTQWLDEDRAMLRLRSDIENAARAWRQNQDQDLLIHRGGRLEDIEAHLQAGELKLAEKGEWPYIKACIELRDSLAREREARNLVFVANDLLKKDLTKAIRMAQTAYCLDRNHTLPQVSRALSGAYYTAIKTQSSFYVANLPHEGAVQAIAFSPDGQKVVTASADETARLWNSRGDLLQTMEQGAKVMAAAFAPDGSKIVTAGHNYLVKMWNGNGRFLKEMVGHGPAQFHDIDSIAFAPDGQTIVTVGADHKVVVWSGDGQLQQEITDHGDVVRYVTFSPNGQQFITCGVWWDSTARLYSRAGELLAELGLDEGASKKEHHWQRGISSAAFAPDNQLIVTTSHDFTAKMWDSAGNHLQTLTQHEADVNQVAFSPDGRWFATVSDDKTAIIWDRAGNLHRRLEGHATAIKRVAFAPQDNLLATGDEYGLVKLWNLEGQLLANLNGHSSVINALSFSPDGVYVVTASSDRTAKIWKALPPVQTIFQHDSEVVDACFIPDGSGAETASEILTASNDLTVKRWGRRGELLKTYAGCFGADNYNNKRIFSLDVSPDGQRFVTTGTDYLIRIWDLASGDIVNEWDSREGQSCNDGGWCGAQNARYAFDGQTIITADFGGQVKLWDSQGNFIRELQQRQPNEVTGVAISRDNRYIATGCHDHIVRLWDFESGALLKEFKGHREPVFHLDFAPDGQHLLSASADYTVKLWDLEGNVQLNLDRHANQARTAYFSPDGQFIITSSFDNTAKLWDLSGKLVSTIEGHLKWLRSAVFAPNGRAVLTASGDGTARLWRLTATIYAELDETYSDIYRLTERDLEEYGLDGTICGPCIRGA